MRRTRVGSVNDRFNDRYEIDLETGCWNWTGALNVHGYGLISGVINGKRYAKKGARMLAHRVSWLIHRGEISQGDGYHGTIVMHICDNRRCVNPEHLRLGTQSENVLDMDRKGRRKSKPQPKGIDHCRSAFKSQADIDLICSTVGKTKELAERFGVCVATIKDVRRRNGVVVKDAHRFANKPLSKEAIEHIRSTPPGTRGLAKLYGVTKETISNIRRGLTHIN